MSCLTGKVALVTGAGRKKGMGRAIALRLAKDGADIVITDMARSVDGTKGKGLEDQWWLDDLVAEIMSMGRNAFAITADLRDGQQIRDLVKAAWDRFGWIDILVNNAALQLHPSELKPVIDYDEENWRKEFDINLTAPFLICKGLVRKMIERRKGGKIISISSRFGKIGAPNSCGYCASKFGLIGLTQTMAMELGQYGINVNAVCPFRIVTYSGTRGGIIQQAIDEGATEQEAFNRAYADAVKLIPLQRPGVPNDVANAVAFLASSESDFMTGQSINVDGGQTMW
jgi:NAD(P)-dependent dehydrogenase (short-subunit alcohol dehydrogenase family)